MNRKTRERIAALEAEGIRVNNAAAKWCAAKIAKVQAEVDRERGLHAATKTQLDLLKVSHATVREQLQVSKREVDRCHKALADIRYAVNDVDPQ